MNLTTAAEIFDANASIYQERFMDVSAYAVSLKQFADLLPQGATLLDVGCGPGNISTFLRGLRSDVAIYGIDAAPNMIALAKQNVPDGTFCVKNALDIATIQQRFIAVVLGFVLPYLSGEETQQLITDAAALLTDGGIIYISTMEEDEHNKTGVRTSKYGSICMYYHSGDMLRLALETAGCHIVSISRQPYNDANGAATDLLIVAQKG